MRGKKIVVWSGLNRQPWISVVSWNGPWPDQTRSYFWPVVNKRPTHLWPNPKRFFFIQREKNWKIWYIKGEIFKTQTQTKDCWPNPSNKNWPDPTRIKYFWPCPFTSCQSPPAFYHESLIRAALSQVTKYHRCLTEKSPGSKTKV